MAFSYTTDRLVEMQWCAFFCRRVSGTG
ncbi:hypothetical protein NGH10_24330, partial [Escherichia coli]|nr:hypothetical protein [Escherichia coli]